MATTKLLNIGTPKRGGSAHLYNSIEYILKPEKTENGLLVGGNSGNTTEEIYDVMMQTKKDWEKLDKRQGYHFIISFLPGEADSEQVYKVIRDFCEEYLGEDYDYVFAVHTDKKHLHGHIVFNSVNRMSGYKYRYEKGDWEKYIQPVTDKICATYGLPQLEYDKGKRKGRSYAQHKAEKEGRPSWKKIIRADIDYVISCSEDFSDFLKQMRMFGYEIKDRKYLTFLPPGARRGHRDYLLGDGYTREDIQRRILYKEEMKGREGLVAPRLQKAYDKGIQELTNTTLSGFQQKKLRQFYKAGNYLNQKNPFALNQKEVRKNAIRIDRLYQECRYLLQHEIHSLEDLEKRGKSLEQEEKTLKNIRSAQYINKDDPMYQEYLLLCKKLKETPDWDDRFEDLQEELKELEGMLPAGFQEAVKEEERICAALKSVRQEKRMVKRIQSEELKREQSIIWETEQKPKM